MQTAPTPADNRCCGCELPMTEANDHCRYPGNHPKGTLDPLRLAKWLRTKSVEWGDSRFAQAADLIENSHKH